MRPGNIVMWAGHASIPESCRTMIGIILELRNSFLEQARIRWSDGQDYYVYVGHLEVVS